MGESSLGEDAEILTVFQWKYIGRASQAKRSLCYRSFMMS
jgi:hypothetical protein